jgi:hypothetical protein
VEFSKTLTINVKRHIEMKVLKPGMRKVLIATIKSMPQTSLVDPEVFCFFAGKEERGFLGSVKCSVVQGWLMLELIHCHLISDDEA